MPPSTFLPLPPTGGPRITGTWADAGAPSRATVWRHIRALRYQPPGRADKRDRKRIFGSALEQAEQLFTAAEAVDYAARPILLFYGLSQAGRAVAAASTAADNNGSRLTGHGIEAPRLDQQPPLHELTVVDKGKGSFTQLAALLQSGTLPQGATVGEIWATIPSLLGTPLGGTGGREYLPPLRFTMHGGHGGLRPGVVLEFLGWVHGLPARFADDPDSGEDDADSGEAVRSFLAGYPTLAGSDQSLLDYHHIAAVPDDLIPGAAKAFRSWPWPDEPPNPEVFVKDFEDRRTLPYLGDDDRWVFPALGGSTRQLHPLLAWWALLFALSMLARYEPAGWTGHLDVDASPHAVALEAGLGQALDICPQLILHAICAAGRS
jgi:hypothetical protein